MQSPQGHIRTEHERHTPPRFPSHHALANQCHARSQEAKWRCPNQRAQRRSACPGAGGHCVRARVWQSRPPHAISHDGPQPGVSTPKCRGCPPAGPQRRPRPKYLRRSRVYQQVSATPPPGKIAGQPCIEGRRTQRRRRARKSINLAAGFQ